MSVVIAIENEIVHLISLQKQNIKNAEKQISRYPANNEAVHQMEAFKERAKESIAHLSYLLIEVGHIRKHFTQEHLLDTVYNFYGLKLEDALKQLKKCNYDFKFNKDFSHFVSAYELIQYVRNNLPKAEKASQRQREKEVLDHYHIQT